MRRIILTKEALQYHLLKEEKEELREQGMDSSALLDKLLIEIQRNENNCNWLMEHGAVAATPFVGALKNICDYVDLYIKQNQPNMLGMWYIEVPTKYTKSIDIFKVLNLYITVIMADNPSETGDGKTLAYDDSNAHIENGQWVEEEIMITAYSDSRRRLYRKTLLNCLVHEINHKFDELKTAQKINNSRIYNDGKNFGELAMNIPFSHNAEITEFIQIILYRLFSSSELNALIASTYGDLMGMRSKRENYLDDREHLQSYQIYQYICQHFYLLNQMSDEEWHYLRKFLDKDEKKVIGNENFSIQRYKNSFMRNVANCLQKLYEGIEQVAGTYYATFEDAKYLRDLRNSNNKVLIR